MEIKPRQLLATRVALPLLLLTGFTTPALADNLYVTAENPGVQQSYLYTNPSAYGASNVVQDNFNYLAPGYYSNGKAFNGNAAIGNYDRVGIQAANQYGGATGKGDYFTVAAPFSNAPTTLSFTESQRYFGFWLSALDNNNNLSFYSDSTLVSNFNAQDILNFISRQPNGKQYFGNPNSNFLGKDKSEPFAYLNFFADPNNANVKFNRVVFSNKSGGSGFEADNFTIATSYTNTSGKSLAVPFEPSATWGIIILIGSYLARSWRTNRRHKNLCGMLNPSLSSQQEQE
jgi:hypothetical protein